MSRPAENGIVRWLVVLLVASVAVLPMISYGCSPEWARWDATQANAFFRVGETEDALYQLRDAIKKSPRDPVLKTTLAERLIEIDRGDEALKLSGEVLEVYPDNAQAMKIKSLAQKSLGDFEASLETELKIDKHLHAYGRDASSLNQLAYARALANTDLHLAKEDIDIAITALNRGLTWPSAEELSLEVKATMLASMVARSCDAQEEAIDAISEQVKSWRERLAAAKTELTGLVFNDLDDSFPIRQDIGMLRRRQNLRSFEAQAAALLSCRALLYQDIGDMENCRNDRCEVNQFGYDSEDVLAHLPDDKVALARLSMLSAFLDTRGFICSLLPWSEDADKLPMDQHFISSYANAIKDLNTAVFCREMARKSIDSRLWNTMEPLDVELQRKNMNLYSAIMLYHRQTLLQRRGKHDLAKQDEEKIRNLGFEPGDKLY